MTKNKFFDGVRVSAVHMVHVLEHELQIIKENDMILGLAHQTTEERFIIMREAKKLGVKRISADHPQGHGPFLELTILLILGRKAAKIPRNMPYYV